MLIPSSFWVLTGPGMPCGARSTSAMGAARPGTVWLDVCLLGQHLPQMYRPDDMTELTAGKCARLGLCENCLGFGDLGPPPGDVRLLARSLDEVQNPCPGCGGTGRPALRVTVERDGSGIQASVRPLPHGYVPPLSENPELFALFEAPEGMCLACGMPPDGTGPRGEALHP